MLQKDVGVSVSERHTAGVFSPAAVSVTDGRRFTETERRATARPGEEGKEERLGPPLTQSERREAYAGEATPPFLFH
ncbi:hypothetical protein EYF80_066016 [Liparis tanakae]|uniref:Uncharacterized protein n=1 Tax=Liparis tanakae TaxID=230148 RepID=A0A4Z2E692_9TELE|nr:hypothetical protein EYF80_066016 [Liparis tanakae]